MDSPYFSRGGRKPSYKRMKHEKLRAAARRMHNNEPHQTKRKRQKGSPKPTETQTKNAAIEYIPIKPLDPSQPCPIANLPTELRSMIFNYVLRPYRTFHIKENSFKVFPNLFRVSRAIRLEAAYLFYTRTPFTMTLYPMRYWSIDFLDFHCLQSWVDSLPRGYSVFLSMNRNLNIILGLDGPSKHPRRYAKDPDMWRLCCQFGRLPQIRNYGHKTEFLHFCEIAEWWLWCGQPMHEDMKWHYSIRRKKKGGNKTLLKEFLHEYLATPMMQSVRRYWSRSRDQKGKMKKEILNMLGDFDRIFKKLVRSEWQCQYRKMKDTEIRKWEKTSNAVKDYVVGW